MPPFNNTAGALVLGRATCASHPCLLLRPVCPPPPSSHFVALPSAHMQVQKPQIRLSIKTTNPIALKKKTTKTTVFYAISVELPPGTTFADDAAVSCTFRRNNHFKTLKKRLTEALNSAVAEGKKDPYATGRYQTFFGSKSTAGSALYALKSMGDVSDSNSKTDQRLGTFSTSLTALNEAYAIFNEEMRLNDGILTPFMLAMANFVAALDDFYYPIIKVARNENSAFRTLALGWGRAVSWVDENRFGDNGVFSPSSRVNQRELAPIYYAAGKKDDQGLCDADITLELMNQMCFTTDSDNRQHVLNLASSFRNGGK